MIFKLVKEIKDKKGNLHFRRWRIISTPWFKIYLHGIYMADEDVHLHNHPWNFYSLVLKGWYSERLESKVGFNIRSPRQLVKRTKNQFHKIDSLHSKAIYTLNLMYGKEESWGYKVNGTFIEHEVYRRMKREGKL